MTRLQDGSGFYFKNGEKVQKRPRPPNPKRTNSRLWGPITRLITSRSRRFKRRNVQQDGGFLTNRHTSVQKERPIYKKMAKLPRPAAAADINTRRDGEPILKGRANWSVINRGARGCLPGCRRHLGTDSCVTSRAVHNWTWPSSQPPLSDWRCCCAESSAGRPAAHLMESTKIK